MRSRRKRRKRRRQEAESAEAGDASTKLGGNQETAGRAAPKTVSHKHNYTL